MPQALIRLVASLMNADPTKRPDVSEILAQLSALTFAPAQRSPRASFFGRAAELATLQANWRAVALGESRVCTVAGKPGFGKSTLVERFLDELPGANLVLTTRCSLREHVGDNAIDGLVDDLADVLKRRGLPIDVSRLPDAVFATFPSMRGLQPQRDWTTVVEVDSAAQRARALRAIAQLVSALSRMTPVAIWIDDVQWSGATALAAFLESLMAQDGASVLVVMSYRTLPQELAVLTEALGARVQHVDIGPLKRDDAAELILSMCPTIPPTLVQRIYNSAGGSPYLMTEIARDIAFRGEPEDVSIDKAIKARIAKVVGDAKGRLLRYVAIAGSLSVADAFALLPEQLTEADVQALVDDRFIIRSDDDAAPQLLPFHDELRRVLRDDMDPDIARRRNGELAGLFRSKRDSDPRDLFTFYRDAADEENAMFWGHIAARQALGRGDCAAAQTICEALLRAR